MVLLVSDVVICTIPTDIKNEQVLDKLPVEKERGITVKAQAVSMLYDYNGKTYLLNLIDTPGHVDFSYEVSRSISVSQGAILLVDANQGVQAQTVSNFNLAFISDLTIIPVLNKVDLKTSKPEEVILQLKNLFGIDSSEILKISAKLGTGIDILLETIINKIPAPTNGRSKLFRAIVFDSWHDRYRGVIPLLAIVDGKLKVGDIITSHITGNTYEVKELGILHPEETSVKELFAGQVGYLTANIKSLSDVKMGDTFHHEGEDVKCLSLNQPFKPMVYAGIYAVDQSYNLAMRNAIEKLLLNDSSVTVAIENSPALGQGWRLGFLGLLHLEVFCERLDQEFDAQVVITAPSVPYKVKISGPKNIKLYGSEELVITDPLKLPDPKDISEYFEPMVIGTIITPVIYVGSIMKICMERRGIQKTSQAIDDNHIMLQYKFPLNEVIVDFYDELKSISSGYASFDYEEAGYESSTLVKMNILLNGQQVDELTTIVHTSKSRQIGQNICLRLKETIPQQQFEIAIQAAVGGKIIFRENIKALRKNVLAKCYGGDITRKMKLLKRQAEGKKRMRMIGKIQVPRDVFIKVLKR
ncbi:translation factor GUF1 homolog, mitochondrial-like [Centruroides sculpturatus]|uniref:translation factor GUF1 homolog, mitochondrial-like n=1 Tax=Centruroides sculpturatus TaxID=218467 RepID=UPI000C6DFC74|nr:translation factor GUF1 homolog, mitochondrial-like [Centruroides sculpturatus]